MLICVDLDGTLLDTVPANAASYRAALEELGFTVTDEYYAERCNGGHYTRFLPPLMGGTPSTADVERVHDRKKALYSDFLDVVRPNTALMEILRTMQAAGHDLACVTTGSCLLYTSRSFCLASRANGGTATPSLASCTTMPGCAPTRRRASPIKKRLKAGATGNRRTLCVS